MGVNLPSYSKHPFTLKVAGLKPWIHHTHTKPAEDPGQEWKSQVNPDQPLKLTLT
jgi:hypothetical protein